MGVSIQQRRQRGVDASAHGGSERYKALLFGEGLLKTAFRVVNSASNGMRLNRAFITGVAPIILSLRSF